MAEAVAKVPLSDEDRKRIALEYHLNTLNELALSLYQTVQVVRDAAADLERVRNGGEK